jgi:hypothetical protein
MESAASGPSTLHWGVYTPTESLRDRDAVVALRLGMAVNALHAVQHFGLLSSSLPAGPRKLANMVIGLSLQLAFLKEAVSTAADNAKLIRRWATDGGATPEALARVRALTDGTDPLCAVIKRVRNELMFHWDRRQLAAWLRRTRPQQDTRWFEAVGPQHDYNFNHSLALDILAESLVPPVEGDDPAESERQRRMIAVVEDAEKATRALIAIFEKAVVTFLAEHGGEIAHEQPA